MTSMWYPSSLDVIGLHDEIAERSGNMLGLRDAGALDAALMRPQMAAHYEGADLATQAALFIAGITLAHAFVDANKRTALATGLVFLHKNGCPLHVDPLTLAKLIESIAADAEHRGEHIAALARLIATHCAPASP